jgi:hypothetical protein
LLKPGTDKNDLKMSDVLCDFCHAEWSEERPLVEGHRGATICGSCLATAYAEVVGGAVASDEYSCIMCRESQADREALGRGDEPGWPSPSHPEAALCRRCVKLCAGVLEKDPDIDWRRPATP